MFIHVVNNRENNGNSWKLPKKCDITELLYPSAIATFPSNLENWLNSGGVSSTLINQHQFKFHTKDDRQKDRCFGSVVTYLRLLGEISASSSAPTPSSSECSSTCITSPPSSSNCITLSPLLRSNQNQLLKNMSEKKAWCHEIASPLGSCEVTGHVRYSFQMQLLHFRSLRSIEMIKVFFVVHGTAATG